MEGHVKYGTVERTADRSSPTAILPPENATYAYGVSINLTELTHIERSIV